MINFTLGFQYFTQLRLSYFTLRLFNGFVKTEAETVFKFIIKTIAYILYSEQWRGQGFG